MAKLPRVPFIRFGSDGPTDDFAKFGSQTAGSPVKTKDIAVIQSLDAWLNGWKDAIVSANKAPFLEDMNSLFLVIAYMIAYQMEEGIPEWDGATKYFIGSFVKKAGTPEIYSSKTDNNLGNALPNQVDDANWKYFTLNNKGYRRPILQWISITQVDIEAQTGNSNETQILFSDGNLRTVVEDTSSGTPKYRRFNITQTANFISGTEASGLRSGLSEAANTWYALYAVKSQINDANFVLVGDTTGPTQANFSTLNSRYGTNGWIYLGLIRNGLNDGLSNSDISYFTQRGSRFHLGTYTISGPLKVGAGITLGAFTGTTSNSAGTVYTHASGFGPGQIPDHLPILTYKMIQKANSIATSNLGDTGWINSIDAGVLQTFSMTIAGPNTNEQFAIATAEWPTGGTINVSRQLSGNFPYTVIFTLYLTGWEDTVLSGLNNAI